MKLIEELREPLGLPNVEGHIIAFIKDRYFHHDAGKVKTVIKGAWRIDIILSGPDDRYSPARESYDNKTLTALSAAFESAYRQMQGLEKREFSGDYRKVIDQFPRSQLEVIASNGCIRTLYWCSSNTHMFSRSLSMDEVKQAIAILKAAEQRGENMAKTLTELTN